MNPSFNCAQKRRSSGFTLIEISVALGVMATMLMGAVPLLRAEQQRAKEAQLKNSLMQIRYALDRYKQAGDEGRIARAAGSSGYPASLAVLARGEIVVNSPKQERIYFLRRIPRDPFASAAMERLPPELTWQTRAYSSAPDAPASGADVFDVFSQSTRLGSDGLPYSKW